MYQSKVNIPSVVQFNMIMILPRLTQVMINHDYLLCNHSFKVGNSILQISRNVPPGEDLCMLLQFIQQPDFLASEASNYY